MNPLKLSIFEEKAVQSGQRIYVNNIQGEIRQIFRELGGVTVASRQLGLKLSRVKEWPYRGKPISLANLVSLLRLLPENRRIFWQKKIDGAPFFLSGRYSSHAVRFPKRLTTDLAYVLGLILGDGTLKGDSTGRKRGWVISVVFDNPVHASYYGFLIRELFNVSPAQLYPKDKHCQYSYFASRVVHWFFRTYFGFHEGKKAHKIEIPVRLLETKNFGLLNACLRGLFDSDGTMIPKKRTVKFASVSKKIVEQVGEILETQRIRTNHYQWLKDPQYRMLYDI